MIFYEGEKKETPRRRIFRARFSTSIDNLRQQEDPRDVSSSPVTKGEGEGEGGNYAKMRRSILEGLIMPHETRKGGNERKSRPVW